MSLFGGTRVERLIIAVGATGTEATNISIFQDPDSLRVCFICAYGLAFLAHGLNCGQSLLWADAGCHKATMIP